MVYFYNSHRSAIIGDIIMPSKKLKIVSSTGCVHLVDSMLRGRHFPFGKRYVTKCNHNDYHRSYGSGYFHDWELTEKPVTCKRCLRLLNPLPKPNFMKEALEDIRDLAVGYDGFTTIEGLKSLIDDMQNIAVKALNNKKWCTTVPPQKKE